MIYLDNAATTFPKPEEVYRKLDFANRNLAFNAGRGESNESESAAAEIFKAREAISSLIDGCSPNQVVFSSSATDALNKIILGLNLCEGDTVYVSPFEHNAIIRPLHRLAKSWVRVEIIPFNKETWDLDEDLMIQKFALHNPTAVFISHVSNVTGYELPYKRIFDASAKYGSVNVLDCAQSFGIIPVCKDSNISYLVFDGHKSLYGSFGVGGFIAIHDSNLEPVIAGGTGSDSLNPEMPDLLPQRYESGSLNVVAISSLVESCKWIKNSDIGRHERKLSEYTISELRKNEKVKVFLPKGVISNGIVSFDVDGYLASDIGIVFNSNGISIRTGYHCAPLVHRFIGSDIYGGTARISFGAFNSLEDAKKAILLIRGL